MCGPGRRAAIHAVSARGFRCRSSTDFRFVPWRSGNSTPIATWPAIPYDVRGESKAFPHATANSECRNEAVFAARNAIDGCKENRRHGGWPYQSWGPEQRKDLWWQVDFGREVEIDKLVITIRADFPHDKHWKRAMLVFSDGSRKPIGLEKTFAPQTVVFPARKTTWVRLADLTQDEPLGWCR